MKRESQSNDSAHDPARRETLTKLATVTAATLVAAVLPRMRVAMAQSSRDGSPPPDVKVDWRAVVAASRAAISQGVDAWTANAQLVGGVVNGSSVFLPPGALSGQPQFDASVTKALGAVAPAKVAAAIGGLAWEVWAAWSGSYHAELPRAFPDFAAVPGPEMAETSMDPVPLHKGSAPGNVGITEEVMAKALVELLGDEGRDPAAERAAQDLAHWYDTAFRRWFKSATLVGVTGKGPIPTFAPPYVPVGPVVAGSAVGFGVLEAQPFR